MCSVEYMALYMNTIIINVQLSNGKQLVPYANKIIINDSTSSKKIKINDWNSELI